MAEQYSIQAETLMKAAVEEYKEILLEIDASDANESVLKGIRINIQGKPRRLVDVGDLKKTEDKNKLQILVFNTDHIELITEKIDEVGFDYEIDGQFINIDVPDPSYKQLMEVVDNINRKKNSSMSRLTKAKSEATTRARTAVENEFITQGVATAASRKCDAFYEEHGGEIEELTTEKIKQILGAEFFEKYKTEEIDPFQ
ncbi:MAG: Ribosome-recycling factor [Alphaproteobacteria bacterium MarineAlpha8_Bin1]|nr:MAG: Ribosome-recycling factor [Alphaproteobacteria bacterium MarineAlpha8_Bin1]|tara:strand:+ start:695 stop:1294 length:600 start_codon:yes stop_codon:yes gene_type:complete